MKLFSLSLLLAFTFTVTAVEAAPRKPRPGTVIVLPKTVIKGRAHAPQVVYYIPLSGELRKLTRERWDMFSRPRR